MIRYERGPGKHLLGLLEVGLNRNDAPRVKSAVLLFVLLVSSSRAEPDHSRWLTRDRDQVPTTAWDKPLESDSTPELRLLSEEAS